MSKDTKDIETSVWLGYNYESRWNSVDVVNL